MRLPQPEPDKWLSGVLAALVHAVLAALLVLGVQWQTRAPEMVEVQLYRALPSPERVAASVPLPRPPEIKPEPKPVAKPEPKSVPEPRHEPPKPDIVRKVPEKKKPVEAPKAVEKPAEKVKPVEKPVPQRDWSKELNATEQNISRQKATDAAAKELQDMKAAQAASLGRAEAAWADRIRAAIKRHIVVPPGVTGNPEAGFDVSILPDGTVLNSRLRKPSGFPALDAAIDRAIQKASPLPRPENPGVFKRELKLTLRPLEDRE